MSCSAITVRLVCSYFASATMLADVQEQEYRQLSDQESAKIVSGVMT